MGGTKPPLHKGAHVPCGSAYRFPWLLRCGSAGSGDERYAPVGSALVVRAVRDCVLCTLPAQARKCPLLIPKKARKEVANLHR